MKIIALIPARLGSKRVPGKNQRMLGGKPLLQWTLEAARSSGVFDAIAVCSDDPVPIATCSVEAARDVLLVERAPVPDMQPDIVWVRDALFALKGYDAFAILRPTSPFRTGYTIQRALARFSPSVDSVRAVQPVRETPYKMWTVADDRIWPLLHGAHPDGTPYHSSPTQSLPPVFVQNSSLEIGWSINLVKHKSISGPVVRPFYTDGWEGFAIDYPEDWARAERHVTDINALACV